MLSKRRPVCRPERHVLLLMLQTPLTAGGKATGATARGLRIPPAWNQCPTQVFTNCQLQLNTGYNKNLTIIQRVNLLENRAPRASEHALCTRDLERGEEGLAP